MIRAMGPQTGRGEKKGCVELFVGKRAVERAAFVEESNDSSRYQAEVDDAHGRQTPS